MAISGNDLGGGASGAEVYSGEVVAHFTCSVAAVGGVTLAEPAVVADAPAFDGGVI